LCGGSGRGVGGGGHFGPKAQNLHVTVMNFSLYPPMKHTSFVLRCPLHLITDNILLVYNVFQCVNLRYAGNST